MDDFRPVTRSWFAENIGQPTPVQNLAWPAIRSGGHCLISAPTGTGKTLSAFLVFIDRYKAMAEAGELAEGLRLVYISPLKALGNDIRENLRRPLSGIPESLDGNSTKPGSAVTAAIRNGDTTTSERTAMLRHPPHILITTPESLYLLLTSQSGRNMLKTAEAVVIDELHSLISTKRGAHLTLSLARLDALAGKPLQRIALSATIEPLDLAARYLAPGETVTIAAPPMEKDKRIHISGVRVSGETPDDETVILPPKGGMVWPRIAALVVEQCEKARSVIAFTDGRAFAEKLAFYVNQIAGEGFARTHHGCVSKEQRLSAERDLREGRLRLLCATSSMELGIDVGDIDMVVQIGCPATVSGTMQRLGRAGHKPGRQSVMTMYPRTVMETLGCALTASAAKEGGVELARPPELCLDVLAQHLVSMAAAQSYTVPEAMDILQRAYNFRNVTLEQLENVLRMLAGDWEHRADRPVRPRLLYDRIHGQVEGDNYSRMLAVSAGGTIPDMGYYEVRLQNNVKLGELDEEFCFEARTGDRFLLGSFAWRILSIQKDKLVVEPAPIAGARPPFWKNFWMGRPIQTARRFGEMLREMNQAIADERIEEHLISLDMDDYAAGELSDLLRRQVEATGSLHDERTIILEHFSDDAGAALLMIHSVFGKPVNAPLGLLLLQEVKARAGGDWSYYADDDGILIFPYITSDACPENLLFAIDPERVRQALRALVIASPNFAMCFRYNIARALMAGVKKKGRVPLWVQRLRAAQSLEQIIEDATHPLIVETRRECMEDLWDVDALLEVLRGVRSGQIAVREIFRNTPSPLSMALRYAAEAEMTYDYTPVADAVKRQSADELEEQDMLPPDPRLLAPAPRRAADSPAALHSRLMTEGDLCADDVDAPIQWLEELARNGRALYIEPGLWIAAEQEPEYRSALESGEETARLGITRRCLRYRGGHDAPMLAARYAWSRETAAALLEALEFDKRAVFDAETGLFHHAELYRSARRQTLRMRRDEITTAPPEAYAAWLCAKAVPTSGTPAERLKSSLTALAGIPLPAQSWERLVLPARIPGYRPALLDAALTQGDVVWRFLPGEGEELVFEATESIDWDNNLAADGLTEAEETLLQALNRRGASFLQGLSALLPGGQAEEALLSLTRRGLVRSDSFHPVRRLGQTKPAPRLKAQVRDRIQTMTAGRWEIARPALPLTDEDALRRDAARFGVLCRETVTALSWARALEILRVWEYTGQARRGYFVSGLSGAQFILDGDYASLTAALSRPSAALCWLNATDPLQPWGHILPHPENRSFMLVSGTVVGLFGGQSVCVFERSGAALRVFDPEPLGMLLNAFVACCKEGRLYCGASRLILKESPPEAETALLAAGFIRDMRDFTLYL